MNIHSWTTINEPYERSWRYSEMGKLSERKLLVLGRRDETDRYVNIYGKKGFDSLTTNKKAIAENKLDDREKEN